MMMNTQWKVGELAAMTGLTIRTLRYYDQIGLFSPSGHTESGHRIYNGHDLARLQQILSLKELGLSLDEVKEIVDGNEFSPLDIVQIQMDRLKSTIRLQQRLLQELENVSALLQHDQTLTVNEFTALLEVMKKSKEKFFLEKRTSMERSLDRLGEALGENQPDAINKNNPGRP
ncbi:DNA-binding transcriptional MerR regulator [Paenibacillus rhizosphaerae]|uniref:DNA-binding transcriptional MerR regulator n=2 Tax=Paenibacillus rhizosphaerae TaxID=297318 RepID=A0A839TI53_9BACL|nr:DNA-binding transcriptional MerR regulator [Paenibacillus rhizosphaerae]